MAAVVSFLERAEDANASLSSMLGPRRAIADELHLDKRVVDETTPR